MKKSRLFELLLSVSLVLCTLGQTLGQTPGLTQGLAPVAAANEAKPKYGPEAIRLFQDHSYFKRAEAPDFWALIPYYAAQQTEGSCSVAAIQMVINALRAQQNLGAADELAHHAGILAKSDVFALGKESGIRGVSLTGFARAIEAVMKDYHLTGYVAEVHSISGQAAKVASERKELHEALVKNENSGEDMIVPLFLQADLTGDPEGQVGHFAPVAAFDGKKKRVLILDPDRKWYEPYWVSEDAFFKAMSNPKADSIRPGGWVWIKRAQNTQNAQGAPSKKPAQQSAH